MGQYSIKDLESFTGVKAHTLRIWEQRYNLLAPDRTSTNIRLYDDTQLKTLLNAVMLYNNGYKISHIALLKEADIKSEVDKLVKSNSKHETTVEALIICMINFDELVFEELLSKSISNIGFENTIFEVIYPFFERVGVLWLTDVINPAQEHFVSNIIRQKLIVAIDSLGLITNPNCKKCVTFLHEEELHEIGILMYTYFLKKKGVKVVYLGQVVPYVDVKMAINTVQPDYLLTGFIKPMETDWVNTYIKTLIADFKNCIILTTGYQSSLITEKSDNLKIIATVKDFEKIMETTLALT